jgi:hypothetical protein
MGKVYKRKKRSCPMCKPHKTGGADKQKPKERARTKEAEKEIKEPIEKTAFDLLRASTVYGKEVSQIYGPYEDSTGRKRICIYFTDRKMTSKTYARYLMEMFLGRVLDPNQETVDHINGDYKDDQISNFRLLPRPEHARKDVLRVENEKICVSCVWCHKTFTSHTHTLNRLVRPGKAGPFCSRKCSGEYGASLQNGRANKLERVAPPEKIYYVQSRRDGEIGRPRSLKSS